VTIHLHVNVSGIEGTDNEDLVDLLHSHYFPTWFFLLK